uniref:Uncharacterized protein n=1 Tax=uncultured prokaryote TaxID=198431 RepID=A0A0H5Q5Y1_9ZZZZ|nr:hypothetical protein [uncultured prokaryote]
MTTDHEDVKACYTMGHVYANVLVMRCPHRESYHISARVWLDDYAGETHTLWQRDEECGPFDDLSYVTKRAGTLMEMATSYQQVHETL